MRRLKRLGLVGSLLLVAAAAWGVPSHPPLVPEGEVFDDLDSLLTAMSAPGPIASVAFSPNGKTLASGSDDGTVRLWDVGAGTELRRLEGHISVVWAVSFSPDGKTLASGSSDRTVRLWDVGAGTETRRLEGHANMVRAVSFGPDGKTLASGSNDHTVRLWDVGAGTELRRFEGHTHWVLAVSFSPDGKTLASASFDSTVVLWDVGAETQIHQLEGHSSPVISVAFSPKGKTLASGSYDGTMALWNVGTGTEIRRVKAHIDVIQSLVFSPDGKTLVSGSNDRTVALWDVGTGSEIRRFEGQSPWVSAVALSRAGKTMASGSFDGIVRLWAVGAGTEIGRLGYSHQVQSVAFSPDGKKLASGSDNGILVLWDVEAGTEIHRLEGHSSYVVAVAFGPDGRTLASGSSDRTVRLWDVGTGTEIHRLEGHSSYVTAVAFDPDGQILASASSDGTVRLWGVGTGNEIHRLKGHTDSLQSFFNSDSIGRNEARSFAAITVAFSSDGETVASASSGGTVALWDVETGTEIHHIENPFRTAYTAAFSPDGENLASGSFDGIVTLSDVATGTASRHFQPRSAWVRAVAFGPAGKTLASGSSDRTVRLWDVGAGTEIGRLEGHSLSVHAVAFSPDGKRLASGSDDGAVRLWAKSETGAFRLSQVFFAGPQGRWVAWRADGRCLRYDDGTLLHRSHNQGQIESVPPEKLRGPAVLELLEAPMALETIDGEVTPFRLTVRNNGPGKALRLAVRRAETSGRDPLVFHDPANRVVVDSGDVVEFDCGVSIHSRYDHPVPQTARLHLVVTNAFGDPIPVEPIEVRGKTPALEWREARWTRDRKQLTVSLTNVGEQDLSQTVFTTELLETDVELATFQQPVTAETTVTLSLSLPEDFDIPDDARVTLKAHKRAAPVHEWTFAEKPVLMPFPLWPAYLAVGLLLAGSGVGVARLRLYRHPLVTSLSAEPKLLLTLAPGQLATAAKLLRRTGRLASVLSAAHVHGTWLDEAVVFTAGADPEARVRHLAQRLGVQPEQPRPGDPTLRILPLGPSFPLNLDRCFVYLPAADRPVEDVVTGLRQRPELRDQVTLVLSADPDHQEHLHRAAADRTNLWVAPAGSELTGLLLAVDPVAELARLVASQVSLTRISPYPGGGGVTKGSIFFGRQQILAHVLNREPANYLVVGGRQIGKSSLLRAIERHLAERPQVDCRYVVLSDHELIGPLARAYGLPRRTEPEKVGLHLGAEDGRRRFVLIDEADAFIRAERRAGYPTLAQLRSLSEAGRCHFILAGFWDLYQAAALDYQSPLKNFGETLRIGALEAEACRELATAPMATMGLEWESEELVGRLVGATGGRANLISIACNEILKGLDLYGRTIRAADLDRALAGDAIRDSLADWKYLTGEHDPASERLDRILVYATIAGPPFTLAGAVELVAELGEDFPPDRVERSLRRLELAFVLGREDREYHYRVPLFEQLVRSQEPEVLLRRELGSAVAGAERG